MKQTTVQANVCKGERRRRFEAWIPRVARLASWAFRRCEQDLREELIAETIADVFCAYARLVDCGREHDAHLTVLAGYAIKRVGSGLRTGTPRNLYDLTSRYSQLRSGLRVESLDVSSTDREWQQLIVDSRRATPADVAALRIDLRCWLATLSVRDRAIALMLAVGESTSHVARTVGLSPGRVSQLRQELFEAWQRFHGLDADGRELQHVAA
jgi:hypothetical protein